MGEGLMSLSSDDLIKLFGKPGEKDAELAKTQVLLEMEKKEHTETREELRQTREELQASRQECAQLRRLLADGQLENLMLKNLIVISGDALKTLMKRVGGFGLWAVLKSVLTACIHQQWKKESERALNEAIGLPESVPTTTIESIEHLDQLIAHNDGNVTHTWTELGKDE